MGPNASGAYDGCMHPHGLDRVRTAGTRTILYSPFSKGWTARVPKQGTHPDHPGTAVMWDGVCFEVIAIEFDDRGEVRYVMSPWSDPQVIRRLVQYDDQSETVRLAERHAVIRQQKKSRAAALSAMFLGHVPASVQSRIGNELGVSPQRLTVTSCIPPLVLFGISIYLTVGAKMSEKPSPVPLPLLILAGCLFAESAVRFYIAMSQSRGVGSALGVLGYIIFWVTVLRSDPARSPFKTEKGHGSFRIPPDSGVELQDEIETLGPLLSLLSEAEQRVLERDYGYDYRRHAPGITWIMLVFGSLGAASSVMKLFTTPTVSAAVSIIVAGLLTIEQIKRLRAFPQGPAGSMMGVFVRPFVRRLFMQSKD